MQEKLKCCFCGKEITEVRNYNNPEPLNCDEGTVCCIECDVTIVRPFRRIVWKSWVDKEMERKITEHFRSLSVEMLRKTLPQEMLYEKDKWDRYIKQLNIGL